MKLVKPTDEELNAAFAEKVCGWSKGDDGYGYETVYSEKVAPYKTMGPVWKYNFVKSADAVLPYIQKLDEVGIHYCSGDWFVRCWSEDKNCANCDSLPKACVIALLRAHGVEVET